MITLIKKFKRLPVDEKKLLFTATFMVIKVRMLTAFLPLRFYSSNLGVRHKTLSDTMDSSKLTILYKVTRTLKRTSTYIPFKNKCLVEAIVAKKMLKALGYESTLYLGVGRDEDKKIIAHAWLKCCGTIVTGKEGMDRFAVVEWFS